MAGNKSKTPIALKQRSFSWNVYLSYFFSSEPLGVESLRFISISLELLANFMSTVLVLMIKFAYHDQGLATKMALCAIQLLTTRDWLGIYNKHSPCQALRVSNIKK